ncbi:MAG: hypothetical protein IPJ37_03060 [Bacteroidales bacterium]|nr:hypothetical protein [Bacteroidales bacterium]
MLQGTLTLGGNYTLEFSPAVFTITPKAITVTADAKSKVYGEADPDLTYEITSGELVANGDAFVGALSREPGEEIGIYQIIQGTLSLGANYDLTFEGAELEITKGFEMTAYPNPFTDHLTLEFDLNYDAEVSLEIFNIVGVRIATVFTGHLTADHYLFNYEPDHISDGMIIYKLVINGHEMFAGKAIKKK